jgi:thiol:disulfide interchange protein/DsbC/DsbD-like thiol-disulfide interchange protein
MRVPRLLVLGVLALAALGQAVRAQVSASLVSASASIAPGQPFTVALRLVHQPGWHSYWLNPGTGLPTKITWDLPPGWKAGPIRWPAPKVLVDDQGGVIGSGYDGDLLLPVELTPPADLKAGSMAPIRAAVKWLMCHDVCKPGKAALELTLPVSNGGIPAPDSWADRIGRVLREIPAADSDWTVSCRKTAGGLTLEVSPGEQGLPVPRNVHFFCADGTVPFDAAQVSRLNGSGAVEIDLALSPDAGKSPQLRGVLTSESGWRGDGSLAGLAIDVAPGVAAVPAVHAGLAGTLLLAFVGGLILNLMPCVFPVLGIKVLGFVNQAGQARAKVVAHGLVFTAGVVLSFWVLAGALTLLRAGGEKLGWGFQLQSPGFIFALAIIMLVFALNLSGVFEFGLSATAVGGELQSKSGYSGSFFTGVLATLVATPCSAPFLAPALGEALTLGIWESFLIFTTIAIGLSAPYLLLSAFPAAVRLLPRPGAWMETFRQLMAFPLYGTVGYLLWVLAGQVQETGLLGAFIGLVVVAMGWWVYGRWRAPGASAGRARFGFVVGLGLIAIGCWSGWPSQPAPGDLAWDKWSPAEVERLRGEGRIVYVDFTARWCATCQANKRVVFHDAQVLKTIRDRRIALLRGDWTNQDPAITAELAHYHRSAVPFDLIWLPGHDDPVTLPEILTPGIVLKALGE